MKELENMIARYTMTSKLNIVRDKISECNDALKARSDCGLQK